MDEKTKKELEEIMGEMHCPKDFICYKSGLETLCKAKDVETPPASLLVCLETDNKMCKFLNIKRGYVCQCPLRIYIANKLMK
jgi:hypothetical protein